MLEKLKTDSDILTGRVVKIYGTIYEVDYNDTVYNCQIKGEYRKFNNIKDKADKLYEEKLKVFKSGDTKTPITIGDYVKFFLVEDSAEEDKTGIITEIMCRKNKLSRAFDTPTYQSEKKKKEYNAADKIKEHLIASNIDYVLNVNSVKDPPLKTGLIDRLLIAAEREQIEPVIIINKIDLDTNNKIRKEIEEIYKPLGYNIFFVSAKENSGIEEVRQFVKDKTIILAGHSGVGKSSMVNAILGETKLRVSDTSTYHHKGKHTTTNTELVKISGGGYIIDTPGTKLFGLYKTNRNEILSYVKELKDFVGKCKYSSCTHTIEDGCAILQAVEEGKISKKRWKNISYIMEKPSKW